MAKRVTTEERERIVAAFATGKSCRQIAKEFRRSTTTISHIARDVGHEFGQMNTAYAREVNSRYGAEWRANTRQRLSDQIHRMIDSFDQPALVHNFGGKDNTYNEEIIGQPTFRDKRDIGQTVATLWRVVKEIDEYETRQVDKSVLDSLFAEIDRMADEYERTVGNETGVQHQPE